MSAQILGGISTTRRAMGMGFQKVRALRLCPSNLTCTEENELLWHSELDANTRYCLWSSRSWVCGSLSAMGTSSPGGAGVASRWLVGVAVNVAWFIDDEVTAAWCSLSTEPPFNCYAEGSKQAREKERKSSAIAELPSLQRKVV
jgi:hypothetical protein